MVPYDKIMNQVHPGGESVVRSLQTRVLEPLSEAESTAQVEYEEITAERQAFSQFRDRVTGIETTSHTGPVGSLHSNVASRSQAIRRVRSVLRETIMNVDHYDEIYGETLEEFAAAEFSADLAAGLDPETNTVFTELYKTTLLAAVEDGIEMRQTVREQIERELASLEKCQMALVDLLEPLNGSNIPTWYQSDFSDELDQIARTRQESIQQGVPLSRVDGHDLCQYLYHDHQWIYPVLTAITRFDTAVT